MGRVTGEETLGGGVPTIPLYPLSDGLAPLQLRGKVDCIDHRGIGELPRSRGLQVQSDAPTMTSFNGLNFSIADLSFLRFRI